MTIKQLTTERRKSERVELYQRVLEGSRLTLAPTQKRTTLEKKSINEISPTEGKIYRTSNWPSEPGRTTESTSAVVTVVTGVAIVSDTFEAAVVAAGAASAYQRTAKRMEGRETPTVRQKAVRTERANMLWLEERRMAFCVRLAFGEASLTEPACLNGTSPLLNNLASLFALKIAFFDRMNRPSVQFPNHQSIPSRSCTLLVLFRK